MICDKCLSRDVCNNTFCRSSVMISDECSHYKDENCYFKMPCPVGTIVHKIAWLTAKGRKNSTVNGFINQYVVVGAHLKDERSRRNIPREEYLVVREINYGYSHHIPFSQIGVTVFFDLYKAQIKLKEGPDK